MQGGPPRRGAAREAGLGSRIHAGRVDCIVIGAGVVGLAMARRLALDGREVLVVEAADGIGTGTSSRNSEVIHAGIYYAAGSAKARLCVDGKERLYAYCAARGVPHRRIGKLIVAACEAEGSRLEGIAARAAANGVGDLRLLSKAEIGRMEPALAVAAALFSPSTGIIDSHAFMLSLQGEAEAAGAAFAFRTPVAGGTAGASGIALELDGPEPCIVEADLAVNSAGLLATRVAGAIEGLPAGAVPEIRYAKGNYFGLTSRAPFDHLVYPVPEPGGLGVHLTLDMAGRARFGPDVEWTDTLDFRVDPARAAPFYAAIRRYWPGLPDGALQPDYAGIRVKVVGGEPDFEIARPVPSLINLFGIESPGLTASLAIAEEVAALAA